MILVLGKARSCRAPNLGCSRAESWDVLPKHSAQDVTRDQVCCHDEATNHQLSIDSCGLLNHLNSFCRVMFKLNAEFDAGLLFYLLSHFE